MKIIRIGREQSNDYQVNHPSVSRFHSEICIDDNGCIVYIDHSSNGTMINGTIVHNSRCYLRGFETIYLAREVGINLQELLGHFRPGEMRTIVSQPQPYPQPSDSQSYSPSPYGGVKPAMGFGQTLGYFFRHYADFSGRARRTEYWYMMLWNFIFWIIPPIGILWWLATIIPYLALAVRRLHDVGRSGVWYLLQLVPLVGQIIILVWLLTDSEPHPNRWGESPKYN
jgi:uncharacterized membrane protein YhaH (DUF805 family)